jgi:hypothetical protein|tara:strand:+ start:446 stop:643 length:198 start_codon:yes stop_codon:yes gene_type:complete
MEPNIIDLLATDASASEVSDAIKASLFAKSVEKIDALRPAVANNLLGVGEEEGEIEVTDTEEEEN